MTREQAHAHAIEIADAFFERAAEDAALMLEERGATAAEIAAALEVMQREHARLRTDGINEAFRCLAGEALH